MLKLIFVVIILGVVVALLGDNILSVLGHFPSLLELISGVVEAITEFVSTVFDIAFRYDLTFTVFIATVFTFILCNVIHNLRGDN